MNNKTRTAAIITTIALTMGAALPALAQTNASTTVSASVTTGGTTISSNAQASTQTKLANAISRVNQEIQRRITDLTDLNTKVQAMVHVSATEKTALSNTVQTEITNLNALQVKADAETTLAAVKTDIQTMTQDYRIFLLVLPQGRIEVASDKIQTVGGLYTTFAGKLQARISAAPSGTDTTQVNAWLSDMNMQIGNSNTQAQTAVSLVANLQPDQGNATVAASNKTALMSARADIKTGLGDLKTARQDAGNIVKAIESWKVSASASASGSTQ